MQIDTHISPCFVQVEVKPGSWEVQSPVSDGVTIQWMEDPEHPKTSINMTYLQPDTYYEVQITACNYLCWPFPESFVFHTQQDDVDAGKL